MDTRTKKAKSGSPSLSNILRTARESKKYSLRGLEDVSGVNYVTIQRIEAGSSRPTIDTLHKLALALDIDPLILFHAAKSAA